MPIVRQEADTVRDYVFNQTSLKGWTTPREEMRERIVSVRSKDMKLIRIPGEDGTRSEAYDLAQDPQEKNDIYSSDDERVRFLEEVLDTWIEDNRSKAADLVIGEAKQRVNSIADAVLETKDLNRAVSSWIAIQTMEDTWGLEPDRFYAAEPFTTQWQEIQQTAAGMIGAAMTCASRGSDLRTTNPAEPLLVENWNCN